MSQIQAMVKTRWFLTIIILIDFMGMAIVVVSFPHLFLNVNSMLFSPALDKSTRLMLLGLFLAIYPLGQFFGAATLGKLSDHFGRKGVLCSTLLGTFIGYIISALSIMAALPILLFVGRLLTGLCAGNVAVAQASLIDISIDEKSKTQNLTYGQMAMGSAYIIGPVLGGVLADPKLVHWFNASTPFWFFSGLLFLLLLATQFFYKETLTKRQSVRVNMKEHIRQIYVAFIDVKLRLSFIVWFVFICGWWLFESFMPVFLYQKFMFNTTQIGVLLTFNGALYVAFQYLVVRPTTAHLQVRQMIQWGCLLSGLAIVSMTVVQTTWQLYISMAVFVMAMAYAIPGLITFVSNQVSADKQGQIMGMINSVQAVATVLVMSCGGFINAFNDNLTVLIGGLLIIGSLLVYVFSLRKSRHISIPPRSN